MKTTAKKTILFFTILFLSMPPSILAAADSVKVSSTLTPPLMSVRILDKTGQVILEAPFTAASFQSTDNVLVVFTPLQSSPFATIKVFISGAEQPLNPTGVIQLHFIPK